MFRSDRLVPFGREARYVAVLYAQRASVFIGVAMAIVLALDVASNLSVATAGDGDATSGIDTARLGYYILLRAGYVLPSILPIAAIVGVIWAEYGLTTSRQRQMIASSGRSPLKALFPALVFGLVLGTMQFVAAAYLRPLAVQEQAVSGLRYYGSKFTGNALSDPVWFAAGDTIVNARVDFTRGVALRDLRLFTYDAGKKASLIAVASSASPGPGADLWTLHAGSAWDVGTLRSGTAGREGLQPIRFNNMELPLLLNPLWAENFDISPPLLDHATLTALASDPTGTPNGFGFSAALAERYANILYCVGMALLGASLTLLRFSYGMSAAKVLGVAGYGGLAYVSFSAFAMLSTFGNLPPLLGPWLVPLALVCGSSALVAWHDWRAGQAPAALSPLRPA